MSDKIYLSTADMSPDYTITTSIERPPPSTRLNLASSTGYVGLVNIPCTTIRSFSTLLLLFIALLVPGECAAVDVGQLAKAAGGIPGPPPHRIPPKGGPERPPATVPDPAVSPSVSATRPAEQPITMMATMQTSTSSITIFPNPSSTSIATFIQSSSMEPKEHTSASTSTASSSTPSSSTPSTSTSNLVVTPVGAPNYTSSSSPIMVTSIQSEWPKITPTVATTTPTALNKLSTEESLDKRNLTIILATVLTTVTLFFVTSMLFLTRCCTRRPFFSTLCLRARMRIQGDDVPPWGLRKARVTEQEVPTAFTPPVASEKFSPNGIDSPHPQTHPPIQTPILLSPTTTATTIASPKVTFGLTLPSIPTKTYRLSPFPPRPYPNIITRSPTHFQYLNTQSHHSFVSSTQSTNARSLPGTPKSDASGLAAERPPARFTFGDGAVRQWTWEGEQARRREEK